MISILLTDDVSSLEIKKLEVPLDETIIENATDTQTLDGNVSTDFIYTAPNKRQWSHTWAYMSNEDYIELKAFYDRQFTLYKYPLFSCDFYSISQVPVRMSMTKKSIIDNCGTVQGVEVTFRETEQLEEGSS